MRLFLMSMFSLATSFISDCGSEKVVNEPCFTDRAVVETITNIVVECTSNEAFVLLQRTDGNERYSICNSDLFEIQEGMTYTISGKKYEMKPNERWPGAPLELTQLKK
ncbi:hypothetical protein [Portibacter marinus]|uniref:hypothetical protein n=1 Tax=Portibacter marinus TaxID=2898660 RepID=UPI001F3724FB|nr:hypothetical protein [Portibacter marinus]